MAFDIDDIVNDALGLPREPKKPQSPVAKPQEFAFQDPMRELPRLGVQPQPNLPMSIAPPKRLSTDMTMDEMEAGSKLAGQELRRSMMTHMPAPQTDPLSRFDRTNEELLIDLAFGGDTRATKYALEQGENVNPVTGELNPVLDQPLETAFYGTDLLMGGGILKGLGAYGKGVAKVAGSPEALTGALKKYSGGAIDIKPELYAKPAGKDLKTTIDNIFDEDLPESLKPQSGDGSTTIPTSGTPEMLKPQSGLPVYDKPVVAKQVGEFYEVENVQPVNPSIGALQEEVRSFVRRPKQSEGTGFGIQTREAKERADLLSRQTLGTKVIPDEVNYAKKIGQEYQKSIGIEPTELSSQLESSIGKQASIAQAFEQIPRHTDTSPRAQAIHKAIFDTFPEIMPEVFQQSNATTYGQLLKDAYTQALIETKEQFKTLPVKMRFHKGKSAEYKNSDALRDDVRNNNTMNVYQGGDPHEFWNEVDPETGLTGNEMLRAIHDYYGHGVEPNEFGRHGEERAYDVHGQMFSPLAKLALAAETRGQNSWVNYSNANLPMRMRQKELRELITDAKARGDKQYVKELEQELKDTWNDFKFAEQKAILLPAQMIRTDFDGVMPENVRSTFVQQGLETVGTHYSNQPDIGVLSPAKYGTGAAGREKSYAEKLPDEMKPVHFYTPEGTPEAQVVAPAKSMVQTPLKGLYDLTEDPMNFRQLAKEYSNANTDEVNTNLYKQIHGAGFKGFVGDNGVAVAFGETPVKKVADLQGMTPPEKLKAGQEKAGRISTRFPSAVKATEDPMGHDLVVGLESMKIDPAAFKHNIDMMTKYDNWKPSGARGADAKAEQIIDHAKENLLFLYDAVPANIRTNSKRWYDGANKIATSRADEYGITPESAAAVYAALSPQKDWYMNVSLADRVIDIYHNQANTPWDKKLDAMLDEKFPEGASKTNDRLKKVVRGKTLDELETPHEKAMWIRTYDETYGDRSHKVISPEGEYGEKVMTTKGVPSGTGWGSINEISSAVSVLDDPTLENISRQMGGQHKVRNFYNNIVDPNSPNGDVTIDTHAVAAANLQPFSGESEAVKHNFGSGLKGKGGTKNSSITGNKGTYGIYAEAYRRAAEERGILPREMQSITWEAIRGMFNNKSDRVKKASIQVWKRFKRGEISQPEAQKLIHDIAGGINDPTWHKKD